MEQWNIFADLKCNYTNEGNISKIGLQENFVIKFCAGKTLDGLRLVFNIFFVYSHFCVCCVTCQCICVYACVRICFQCDSVSKTNDERIQLSRGKARRNTNERKNYNCNCTYAYTCMSVKSRLPFKLALLL